MLFGPHERHLRSIRDALGVRVVARDSYLRIEGDEAAVESAAAAVLAMQDSLHSGAGLTEADVARAIRQACEPQGRRLGQTVEVMGGRAVVPKTPGQVRYVEAIKQNDLVFCIGPAGTGKTYLAVAMAVSALRMELARRIVLARPAVEAGERLGFLPGDMQAKVNPYLRPLYDALSDMMDHSQVAKYVDSDLIEIVPLAYMRGRTLRDAFIILDEAQNCTTKQMKTFLTRLGQRSKIVVTGDVTQIDLETDGDSGLLDAEKRLAGIPNVAMAYLGKEDIVRHRLVQDIVDAYESRSATQGSGQAPAPGGGGEPT